MVHRPRQRLHSGLWLVGALYCAGLAGCGGGGDSDQPVSEAEPSLSGQILVGDSMRTDNDVNDPAAFYSPNDSIAAAQPLPNPARLVGFVSQEATGDPRDRFGLEADEIDVFRLDLLEGQQLSLQVADYVADRPRLNDIDLFLYDEAGQLKAVSDQVAEFESIRVPAAGVYYLLVEAFAGVNKYVLRVGNDLAQGRLADRRGSVDFLPNEFILEAGDDHVMSAQGRVGTMRLLSQQPGLAMGATPHDVGARLARLTNTEHSRRMLDLLADRADKQRFLGNRRRSVGIDNGLLREKNPKYLTLRLIKLLRGRSDVATAEPNYRIEAVREPADPYFYQQWHYPFIGLTEAWDQTTGFQASGSPLVAVVDTGVLLAHPDLAGQLASGFDFISDPLVAADGDGIDANPNDTGDRGGPSGGSSFHGTHVAGTVAAASDNGRGVAGTAWNALVMPLRVLGVGGGSSFDLVQAIRYAAGLSNSTGRIPARKADIINLSLGCSGCYSQLMQDAISAVRAAGTIVIAAAGNDGNSVPFYPAAYDGVVGVGAVNSGHERARYSNFGNFVDLVAPGGDDIDRNGDGYGDRILSTVGDDSSGVVEYRYGWASGTSMAAPHVAGVAALMKALYPALTPTEFDQAIVSGLIVSDLGPPERDDDFGFGVIDARKSVQVANLLSGSTLPGIVTLNPGVLDFPAGVDQQRVRVQPLGVGGPVVLGVSVDQPWLSVAAGSEVDQNGFGDYQVSVSRVGLSSAVYRGAIEARLSDGASQSVTVYLHVSDRGDGDGDAGELYVLLVDEQTLETSYQAEALYLGAGKYEFRFEPSLADGRYRLYAGSDIDNDRALCDPGESCGAYPTLDDVQAVTVDGGAGSFVFEVSIGADFAAEALQPGAGQRPLRRRE